MTTIYVTNDTERVAAERVAERYRDFEPNFNGDPIEVERGDFLCVDSRDEINGAQLLASVHHEIDGID